MRILLRQIRVVTMLLRHDHAALFIFYFFILCALYVLGLSNERSFCALYVSGLLDEQSFYI